MSYSTYAPRTRLGHQAVSPSPLRQTSIASNGSSAYSTDSDRYPPSRSSTLSSNASATFQPPTLGHRRGKSEATGLAPPRLDYFSDDKEREVDPSDTYASMRKALRPTAQPSQGPPSPEKPTRASAGPAPLHTRTQSVEPIRKNSYEAVEPVRKNSFDTIISPRKNSYDAFTTLRKNSLEPSDSPRTNSLDSSTWSTTEVPIRTNTQSQARTRAQTIDPARYNAFTGASASTSPIRERPATARPTTPTTPTKSPSHTHSRAQSVDPVRFNSFDGSGSPPAKPRPLSMAISRSDSVRAPTREHAVRPLSNAHIDRPELQRFQKSSTGHLRTLSKFAETASEDNFAIKSPEQEVVGLHGRRRLQRTDSAPGENAGSSWSSRNWMDQQRQFLQAYEYLCHIGEAKEWIEDIIHKDIPAIVELEEALRDGVTLAEVVQSVEGRPLRIFRDPKLQWRHSNNYAHFFKFLADVELPDLFRFELVDLYEKKNIPKVIYCIHALSWLLFRKGMVDFRIGNLVGKLQFEDHELEAMQKGLDKSGVSMPNFSGMSAKFAVEPEPEPEPVESEEDRIDRELSENEATILDLQAQIRGAMLRIKLGNMMQHLWDNEELIVDLQSRIRGDWARQIAHYRLDMRRFAITLQSAARGFLIRSQLRGEEEYWQNKQPQVLQIQKLFRGRKARAEVQYMKSKIQRHENGIREFQAAIRGALQRLRISERYEQTRDTEPAVLHIQSMIRGAMVRLQVDRDYAELKGQEAQITQIQAAARAVHIRQSMRADQESLMQQEAIITLLQAAARGAVARKQNAKMQEKLVSTDVNWSDVQSKARGNALRTSLAQLRDALQAESPQITDLQAVARAGQLRASVADILTQLKDQEPNTVSLQSYMRGFLSRQRHFSDLKALQAQTPTILDLQSACRGFIQRQRTYDLLCELNSHEDQIIQMQSQARAVNLRMHIGLLLAQVEEHEDAIIELQALARGMMVRGQFTEKKKFYKENMEKVIKIQSFVRGRQQGEAYKSLTSGKNPPVSTVKNFVHLLNDSDIDFDEEIEFERLRKTVVQHVRQNELAEQYIDQLDIKIALLVKNKITLDEVVKHQKHFGGHVGTLLSSKDISSKDPFDLKALNKNSRKKLEHYQELFFILQTQPQYMARLFKHLREQKLADKDTKRIEQLTMSLFGLAQKRREEYYLLKLMSRSLKEEIDGCVTVQEFTRGNFFWGKLFGSYVRSPRDRKFLKDLFGPLIKENIIDNEHLDLESDPMQIYRSSINNEELSTGHRSRRDPNVSRDQAIKDPETRETFIHHLQDLRDIADQFFTVTEEVLHRMPFGVRYLAQQMFEELREKFPYEPQEQLLQISGHWVWKSYMQPALLQPQHWGVVDRGLSPLMNRNLGEVAKVLGQVAAGRLFGGENVYLQPLNSYITEAIDRLHDIWSNLINVRDAESQFEIDEFNDLFARVKPTLYIKLTDIFAIHNLVVDDLATLCPHQDDALREVIRELGSAKNNENELMHMSSAEITLTLHGKFHEQEDPEAHIKALFMETKRYILYIIRIQTGANLTEIMCKPITPDDEDRWDALVRDEIAVQMKDRHRKLRSSAASTYTTDMNSTTVLDLDYPSLKRHALENILQLQRLSRLSPHNHYQDLLNAIAVDIRTKHRRRIQRAKELEGVRATLSALDDKAHFLDSQLKSYNDYIEQAMVTLQNKRGKKKFLLPFTRQYNHMRELQRSGREYRFGSFKYSARNLAEKGILVSWNGFPERQWDRLDVTISSNSTGIFEIQGSQGSMMIPGAFAEVPLDGLLQAQFDNHQFMNLFCGENAVHGKKAGDGPGGEGVARVNVNLFLHLIFKKFYRDSS